MGQHRPPILTLSPQVATTPDLEHNTRESAVLVLEHLACYKPRVFTKAGLVQPTVDVLLRLMAEPREDEDESVDATPPPGAGPGTFGPDMRLDPAMIESEAASVVASSALSEVVASVPTRLTFQPLVERVVAMAQAPDRHQREAAAEALAATVEGLMDRFHGHVDSIVPVLLALARDPHHRVAERACFAIGRWAVALRQDLVPYEDQLFAQTVTLLGMPHSMTVQAASYALQVLLDDMEQERALRWVHPVMRALGPLVRCPLVQPRSMAIGVIASVAVAAGQAFAPYFAATMAQLEELLQVSDRALLPLRAQASETVGHVANAVGADTFRPHLQPVIHQAMGGLALGDAELDEYTFALFHNLFRCLAEDMRDFAPQLVEYLRSVACEHDVFESVVVRGENMMRAGIGGDEGEDDDNNDDNDDGDDVQGAIAFPPPSPRPHGPACSLLTCAVARSPGGAHQAQAAPAHDPAQGGCPHHARLHHRPPPRRRARAVWRDRGRHQGVHALPAGRGPARGHRLHGRRGRGRAQGRRGAAAGRLFKPDAAPAQPGRAAAARGPAHGEEHVRGGGQADRRLHVRGPGHPAH